MADACVSKHTPNICHYTCAHKPKYRSTKSSKETQMGWRNKELELDVHMDSFFQQPVCTSHRKVVHTFLYTDACILAPCHIFYGMGNFPGFQFHGMVASTCVHKAKPYSLLLYILPCKVCNTSSHKDDHRGGVSHISLHIKLFLKTLTRNRPL